MGGLSSCCTNRDPNEKGTMGSKGKVTTSANGVDLNNKMDLDSVIDEQERFKYLFPFYRMDIKVFDQKLSKIRGIKASSKDTEIILIDDIQKEFNSTAWKESWQNVEKLLKTPEFKVITVTERKAIKSIVPQDKLINYTTKLEIGILALLWCQGSQKDRTAFFLKLANPVELDQIGCTDDELKFIFVKLLEYSTDLPLRYEQAFMDISAESIQPANNLNG